MKIQNLIKPIQHPIIMGLVSVPLFVGMMYLLLRDELLESVQINSHNTVNIYAEGALLYEPPGYIYCKVIKDGLVVVPRRRFMSIGPERKPNTDFDVISSSNNRILAITLFGDVRFLYDVSTKETWPDTLTLTTEDNYGFAKAALSELATDGIKIRCIEIEDYENHLKEKEEVIPPQIITDEHR